MRRVSPPSQLSKLLNAFRPRGDSPAGTPTAAARFLPSMTLVALAFLFGLRGDLAAQGVTTAGIDGVVLAATGVPLEGVAVTAVHEPTGTRYATVSRTGGVFSLPNVRVGGPYTVTAQLIGYREESRREVFLSLGQSARLDFAMTQTPVELEAIVVEATPDPVLNADRTGAQTVVSPEEVENLPSIKRTIRDLARTDPRSDGNFSFGGRNWFYNSISVDGTYFNNTFGLDDPAPGGQTNAEPIPYEAVEQVHVAIAPFDVRQGGFTGGSVNTVTRSGTNEWTGSAFTFYRNDGFQGNTVSGDAVPQEDLKYNQSGFSFGGPIVRDKVFLFLSGEIERKDDPATNFLASTGGAPGIGESRVEAAVLEAISQRMLEEYGYETGPFQRFPFETDNNKLLVKFDANLGEEHNLTLRYNFLDARRDLPPHPFVLSFANSGRGPNASSLPFQNSGYTINNELSSFGLELNSRGATWANRFFASYNRSRDFRDAKSEPFPTIEIGEGPVTYTTVGHEPFSIENNLDTDTWQFTDNVTYFAGRHSLTVGANFELYSFFNSFNIFRHGVFFLPAGIDFDGDGCSNTSTFASLDDFFAATDPANPNQFDFRCMIGSGPFKGEKFDIGWYGAYAQDEFVVTPQFTLTVGLRVDFPIYFTDPVDNPFSRSLTLLDENDNPVTVDQSDLPGVKPLWSPRVGFNWDVRGDRSTQVRGGTGIFSGRPPFVWIGNNYSNPGANPNIFPDAQPVITSGPREGSGGENFILQQSFDVNAFAPDFRWPQVWTTDIAIDQRLPGDLIGTLEFIYGNDINDIVVRNYDLGPPVQNLPAPDGRPFFGGFGAAELNNPGAGDGVYVIDNVGEGWNYSITGQLRKTWQSGLALGAAYAYQQARNNLKSTEIASVLFSNQPVQGDPNNPELSFSEFGQRHRITLTGSYTKRWSARLRTHFGLFFEAAEGNAFRGAGGNRYSFIYSGDVNGDGFGGNDLIYIPRNQSEIRLEDPSQWPALDAFIEQDEYLSSHRGQIAERFGLINPWYQSLDLRILQDIIVPTGGREHTIQVSLDVLNALNLLSSDWGVRKIADPLATNPLSLVRFDPDGTPVFNFAGVSRTFIDDPSISSRWQIQLGVRYLLN